MQQYPSGNQPYSQSQLSPSYPSGSLSDPNSPTWTPPQTPPPAMPPYPQYRMPPPPPQALKRRRIWPWIVGAIAVLIVAGTGAAISGGNNAPVTSPTPATRAQARVLTPVPTQMPTATPTPTGNKIGQPVSLNGWLVTVNGIKVSHGSDFNTPQKPEDVFLWIDVTIHNGTGQSQPVSSLAMFSLKNAATGQIYDQSIDTDAPASPDGTLASGGKLRGTIVFEIPGKTHQVELDFTPDFSGNQVSWTLNVP